MAVVSNQYIKYDIDIQEYFINTDCIVNNTMYTSDELLNIGLDNKALKIISHSVYRLIYDYRRGVNKYAHKKYMRKKIYDNAHEEVNTLMAAMIEAVRGAVESGMDLNAYTNNPSETLPTTVRAELHSADLLDASEKLDYGLDITYTEEDAQNAV